MAKKGLSVKTMKRMLKKAGLKTTGRKAALTRRAKKAHLKMKGGEAVAKYAVGDRIVGKPDNGPEMTATIEVINDLSDDGVGMTYNVKSDDGVLANLKESQIIRKVAKEDVDGDEEMNGARRHRKH